MIDLIKKYFSKYRELIMYVIFGIGTTIVNFATFFSLTKIFSVNYAVANIVAWVLAVAFAYITNKIFVFKGKGDKKEIAMFFSSRIVSLLIEMAALALLVSVIGANEDISKIAVAFGVVIINYILSKFLVFKDSKAKD